MTYRLSQFANSGVRKLVPYQPGMPVKTLQELYGLQDVIKLASNENPYGCSELATQAAIESIRKISSYPDPGAGELKEKLAQRLSIDRKQITLGNGSDSLINAIVQAFAYPGSQTLMSEYAFAMFHIASLANHARPVMIPMHNWTFDCQAIADAINHHTRIIFIANPNNPTGTYIDEQSLTAFLKRVPENVFVVLDEAYYEFSDDENYPNSLRLLQEFPNIIITRTFSKIYGLAGLRVGYAIAHPEVIDILERIRLPFNVSVPAQAAALKALDDDAFITKCFNANRKARKWMYETLSNMGLTVIPSMTNFLLVDFHTSSQPIYESLLKQGIIVRPVLGYGLPNHLRISIGTPEQNQRLVDSLNAILNADKRSVK